MSPHKKIVACLTLAATLAATPSARAGDIPDVVRALGRSAAGDSPAAQEEFAAGFFRGFLHPDGPVQAWAPFDRQGYAAGQAWRRAQPTALAAILHGYGLVRIEADGTWTRGWELSRFVPDGLPGGSWSLSTMEGGPMERVGWTGPLPRGDDEPVRVHVAGWVTRWDGRPRPAGGDDGFLLATTIRRALPSWCVVPPMPNADPTLLDTACP